MPKNYYYAYYVDGSGKPYEPVGNSGADEARGLPVDFRIKPHGSGIPTGASNIIVETTDDQDIKKWWLLTCAHSMYKWNNTKTNGELPTGYTIKAYATYEPELTISTPGNLSQPWPDKLQNAKIWQFGKDQHDFALIQIEDINTFKSSFSVELHKLNLYSQYPPNPHFGGVAESLKRTNKSIGGPNAYRLFPKQTIQEESDRNLKVQDLFSASPQDFVDVLVMHDTVAVGDSGSAVFDKNYSELFGCIFMDDEEHNYISDIKNFDLL